MDIRYIEIVPITLDWSDWYHWSRFEIDARIDPNGIILPNLSGVYEVKLIGQDERLTIGKASNLRMRVQANSY